MTKDERIQGLLEANNINLAKRRALASMLREVRDNLPRGFIHTRDAINVALQENGPS